jgi:phage terminase small subunit
MSQKKTSLLRSLDGNAGRRPVNVEPIVVSPLSAQPPAWMTPGQAEGWHYAIAHLPPGMLRSLDASVLVAWCCARDTHERAAIAYQGQQATLVNQLGETVVNPAFNALDKATTTLLRTARELGFTATSRSSVKVLPETPAAQSRFAALKSATSA